MKKLFSMLVLWFLAMQCAFAVVNINTATEAELDQLPGIGPVKAKAIIAERNKSGDFKSIDDIKRVKGIGDATFDKLKTEITVGGANSAPAAPAGKHAAKPAAAAAASPAASAVPAKPAAVSAAPAKPAMPAALSKEPKGDGKK